MIKAELTVAARKWAGLVAIRCALFRSDYLQLYIILKMAAISPVSTGRKSPLMLRDDLSSTYSSFFLESTVMAE